MSYNHRFCTSSFLCRQCSASTNPSEGGLHHPATAVAMVCTTSCMVDFGYCTNDCTNCMVCTNSARKRTKTHGRHVANCTKTHTFLWNVRACSACASCRVCSRRGKNQPLFWPASISWLIRTRHKSRQGCRSYPQRVLLTLYLFLLPNEPNEPN